MKEMIYRNDRDLSLLDRFKMHTEQKSIDSLIRRSHSLMHDHLAVFSEEMEHHLDDLIALPAGEDYKLNMTSQRDQSSLKHRWLITITRQSTRDTIRPDYFGNFKIIISPKHIGYEVNNSGKRHMTRVIDDMRDDSLADLKDINQDLRLRAIQKVRRAFAEWVARNCHDHAGIYFLDRLHWVDTLGDSAPSPNNAPAQTPRRQKAKQDEAPKSPFPDRKPSNDFNPLL